MDKLSVKLFATLLLISEHSSLDGCTVMGTVGIKLQVAADYLGTSVGITALKSIQCSLGGGLQLVL